MGWDPPTQHTSHCREGPATPLDCFCSSNSVESTAHLPSRVLMRCALKGTDGPGSPRPAGWLPFSHLLLSYHLLSSPLLPRARGAPRERSLRSLDPSAAPPLAAPPTVRIPRARSPCLAGGGLVRPAAAGRPWLLVSPRRSSGRAALIGSRVPSPKDSLLCLGNSGPS